MSEIVFDDARLREMLKQANAYMREGDISAHEAFELYAFVLNQRSSLKTAKYIVPRMAYCLEMTEGPYKAESFYSKMLYRYGYDAEDHKYTLRLIERFLKLNDIKTAEKLLYRLERVDDGFVKVRVSDLKTRLYGTNQNREIDKTKGHNGGRSNRQKKRKKSSFSLKTPKRPAVSYSGTPHRGDYTDVESAYIGPSNIGHSPKSPERKALEQHAETVAKARSFVDETLYPHGVRYGDAYRYRKGKKK